LLVLVLLGTNFTFSCYATGGLETQLQVSLFVSSAYFLVRFIGSTSKRLIELLTISVLLGLALLTRLDSVLIGVVIFAAAVPALWNAFPDSKTRINGLLYLSLPMLLLVGPWLAWKLHFYGDIVPNTYYVKIPSLTAVSAGLRYLSAFLESYWLFPVVLLFLAYCWRMVRPLNPGIAVLAAATLLWFAYVIRVGGDFMEFRFFVPVLPFFFILAVWVIFANLRAAAVRSVFVAMIILGSAHHVLTFGYINGDGSGNGNGVVESIRSLNAHVKAEDKNWEGVGKFLGAAFKNDSDLKIATTAAGAIPYYSDLRTVDMLGLNDEWVAMNGEYASDRPGHQKRATLAYLVSQGVNLVIGHPQYLDRSVPASTVLGQLNRFQVTIRDIDELPEGSRLVEIPVTPKRNLFVIYLLANRSVDEAIARNNWRTYPLTASAGAGYAAPSNPSVYEAGERIRFNTEEAARYLGSGWSGPEENFRWTDAHHASIHFGFRETGKHVLHIRMSAFLLPGKIEAQRVNVELNSQVIARLVITSNEAPEYSIPLPANILREQNVLRFALPDAQSPEALGVGGDARVLGINVEWMEIDTVH
jgi:arabinofuranosyltransferase